MKTQRRRLKADTAQIGVGGTVPIELVLDESDAVNFHGMHYCFSIEPENTDANANGFWVLWCLPAGLVDTLDLPNNFAELNDETFLPYVWGVGCWTASNQAPFHYDFSPSTSRNCQRGARILGRVTTIGISAGLVRLNQTLTGFTS